MELKTYRAATMQEALALVRRDLGPDAAVLHTREVRSGRLLGWFTGAREIEVTASAGVNVPSRLAGRARTDLFGHETPPAPHTYAPPAPLPTPPAALPPNPLPLAPLTPPRPRVPLAPAADEMQGQLNELQQMVRQLCQQSRSGTSGSADLPDALFRLYTELIDAEIDEELARGLIERVRQEVKGHDLLDPLMVKARIARIIEAEIRVTGPIKVRPGRRRLVALVGPTGVGKTTTIAKLAAQYRLKEKRRVGLITVDTYRIAAVEQLRTYADIIDLPMQVVSSPREMRDAVHHMQDLDLILMDTAGRSPKDAVKIRELRALLSEAGADEIHLVLSAVANVRLLEQTAERFAPVGTTAMILTKLDEAAGLGSLLPLVRESLLPLSYLTNGQNVPDDIEVADPRRMSRIMLQAEGTAEEHYA